ncbi:unnamed protein product [Diamesa hyperborea]
MDTCLGDSGGGLQYENDYRIGQLVYKIPTLVGIVSFGIGCGFGAPSVNTNLTSYVDWMESVIFPKCSTVSLVVSSKASFFDNQGEGQDCGTNSEGNDYFGKCFKIKDCLYAFNEYENNQRVLQVCSYSADKNANENLICCSKDDYEKSKLEVKRSLEYNECVERYLEHRGGRYVDAASASGGVGAFKGQFPNMVAVGWTQDDKSIEYNCGGSIITELFIVTAAHCSSDRGVRPDVVRIGDIDLLSDTDDEDVQQLRIANIIRHPQHSFRFRYHDIALIKVDRDIIMNQYVAPACIQNDPKYEYYEAAGYGQTGYNENKSNKLIKVRLEHLDQNDCKDYYHNFDNQMLGRGIVEEQFCAKGVYYGGPEMDTCGGGLQYNNYITIGRIVYEIPTLVGIVSFGIGCAQGAPSVNTNVPSYIDWMESVIFP